MGTGTGAGAADVGGAVDAVAATSAAGAVAGAVAGTGGSAEAVTEEDPVIELVLGLGY